MAARVREGARALSWWSRWWHGRGGVRARPGWCLWSCPWGCWPATGYRRGDAAGCPVDGSGVVLHQYQDGTAPGVSVTGRRGGAVVVGPRCSCWCGWFAVPGGPGNECSRSCSAPCLAPARTACTSSYPGPSGELTTPMTGKGWWVHSSWISSLSPSGGGSPWGRSCGHVRRLGRRPRGPRRRCAPRWARSWS